jgi:hypothetical protein
VDASWRSPVAPPPPGSAPVVRRMIALERDPAAERTVITAIARHYWHEALSRPPERRWFAEALARYLGARASDALLEGRQHWSSRFFGGFVPFAVRALPLSPPGAEARGAVPRFDDDLAPDPGVDWTRVDRAATALFTLERFVGWPTLQPALKTYRARHGADGDPAALAGIMLEQRGSDLSWFFDQAFLPDKRYDYAVQRVTSAPEGLRLTARVELQRVGDAVFGIDGQTSTGPALAVAVMFADGTEVVEQWRGGRQALTLEYTTNAPVVRVTVDPDSMLLLDADRDNNVIRLTETRGTSAGRRATLAWLTWIEDLMLTCLALV